MTSPLVDDLLGVASAALTEAERRELARRLAPWNTPRRRSRQRTGASIPGYDLLAEHDAANPPARSRQAGRTL